MGSLHAEVAPFGITTTIVNPGFFRSELLTEQSTNFAEPVIEAYDERRAKQLEFWTSQNGQQSGDPTKLARALIMIADQDIHVRGLERYFLEEAGFEVDFADDGEAGLERARVRQPQIVITEILLPRMDGLSVCRALKSDPATRKVRVLVFSVLAAEDRALEAGADAFMRKPLDDKLLIETVRSLLPQEVSGG